MRTLPRAPLSPTSSLLESFNTSKTSRPRRTPTNSISYEPTAKNGCFCNEPRQSPSPLTRHLYVARIPTFLLCLDKCVAKYRGNWATRCHTGGSNLLPVAVEIGPKIYRLPVSGGLGRSSQ